ncbi:hypothetical protein EJ04DRAFT_326824 [Polyplosphaeria fusca]|uniref:Uncharacterized protein n=1 Tax=Polyplosphaeria fusca TaxID=682080 RepID=A0A9P4R543_9PLEO|nr:hypothetical protein EJ04DRAFT_326824 [Polyplosphaeria fusca]
MSHVNGVASGTSSPSHGSVPATPNPTPRSWAQDTMEPVPPLNMSAVSNTLDSIAEEVNNAALPSPPVNTPANTISPTPSVLGTVRRARGLSQLGDRLVQLRREAGVLDDLDSSRSVMGSSVQEEEEHEEEDEGEGSGDSPPEGIQVSLISSKLAKIPILLGTPYVDPRVHEFLAAHAAAGDPVTLTLPEIDDDPEKKDKPTVVPEASNWAAQTLDEVGQALKRIEQMAEDDADVGQSLTARDYYFRRLRAVLASEDRKWPVTLEELGVTERSS